MREWTEWGVYHGSLNKKKKRLSRCCQLKSVVVYWKLQFLFRLAISMRGHRFQCDTVTRGFNACICCNGGVKC